MLAHEYYGHAAYRNTKLPIGAWNGEFRASYRAAIKTPGLTDLDRYHLMQDAILRAREAGVPIKPNRHMTEILYGF